MKKILTAIILLIMLSVISIQAYAITPVLQIPNIPKVPEIKVELKLPDNYWADYFWNNPFKIDFSKIKFN